MCRSVETSGGVSKLLKVCFEFLSVHVHGLFLDTWNTWDTCVHSIVSSWSSDVIHKVSHLHSSLCAILRLLSPLSCLALRLAVPWNSRLAFTIYVKMSTEFFLIFFRILSDNMINMWTLMYCVWVASFVTTSKGKRD